MESGFDLLVERGLVYQSSNDQALRAALTSPMTLYCGYDPTASSLTVGHLVPIMMLAHLQRAGHRTIALVGGGTTMVGDPTGKTEARQLLSKEQIASNQEGIKAQLGRYLDFSDGRAQMVNNADWLLKLGYIDFLREIGRHFSVNQMLQHETYRDRLQGSGLSFIEMNYVLLQAYDFLHLYREYGCTLQVGGSDQWFNILAGTELTREGEASDAFYVMLDGTADVRRGGVPVNELGSGDFFGEIGLLGHSARTASVVATTDVRTFVIPARAFRSLIGRMPEVHGKVLAALVARGS